MDAAFAEWVRVGLAFEIPFDWHGSTPYEIMNVVQMPENDIPQVMLFCKDLETKKEFAIAFAQSLEAPPAEENRIPMADGQPGPEGSIWMELDDVHYDPWDRIPPGWTEEEETEARSV